MRIILKDFRIIDEETDRSGTVIIEDGIITEILPAGASLSERDSSAGMLIDGKGLSPSNAPPVLMPAFVDLHAHFRDPGPFENDASLPSEVSLPSKVSPLAEVLESASLAAVAGGFGTVVCMANTRPATDSVEKAAALKARSDTLGLIDLYPVISLTKGMEGKELTALSAIAPGSGLLMLSEDGKDIVDDDLFLAAMTEAKRIGIPISCHCSLYDDENRDVSRVIELGKKALCHIHIAHVSTKEAIETIRQAKAAAKAELAAAPAEGGFKLSCEAMPHNICLTKEDAARLGETTHGRVNPPLRSEEDRKALIQALADGTVDAIATDHAPHSQAGKEAGAPGFSGFENAFAAVFTELCRDSASSAISLKDLSSLMSARPARLLFGNSSKDCSCDHNCECSCGRILPGCRADLVIVDTEASWVVEPSAFKSRGKNSPFAGRKLYGKVLMTLHRGKVVYCNV